MREDPSTAPTQELAVEPIATSSEEPVPLEQKDLDGDERVNYKADTETYLTKPDDTGFKGDTSGYSYMLDDEPEPKIGNKVASVSISITSEPVLTIGSKNWSLTESDGKWTELENTILE
ncbi:uncharacterized protein LOC109836077 [Asparagus officinalis]|uniref:uncharacterized protein LOC109836077 n=1 Tax=Asparagus officinalis TaxID=4686 RepID=UPI00098E290F|nr:uncharacterized protein LOC109836077 [Asparagus officinalis]